LICSLLLGLSALAACQAAETPFWQVQPAAAVTWQSVVPTAVAGASLRLLALKLPAQQTVTVGRLLPKGTKLPPGANLLYLLLPTGEKPPTGTVACTLGATKTPSSALQPGLWQACNGFTPKTATALDQDTLLNLQITCSEAATLCLAWPEPLQPLTVASQLSPLGNYLLTSNHHDLALATWQQYEKIYTGTPEAARGLLYQGDALRGLGKLTEAAAKYRLALQTIAPAANATPTADPTPGDYGTNRLASDLATLVRSRLVAVASGNTLAALEEQAACWPPNPESKAAALQLAQARLAKNAADPLALGDLLLVFDQSGEHTTPGVTKLADNQALLNRISTVTAAQVLEQALTALAQLDDPQTRVAWQPDALKAAVQAWQEAEQANLRGDGERAARQLLALAKQQCDRLLGDVATLAAGQVLTAAGLTEGPDNAAECFSRLAGRAGAVGEAATLGLAEVAFSQGDYLTAGQSYSRLSAQATAPRQRDWATYRLAECLEFQGKWAAARRQYQTATGAKYFELASEATQALRRLTQLSTHPPLKQAAVRFLGEDRVTGGDWYTYYGSEAFILCAQQAPQDIAGGLRGDWSVTPRTGSPKEEVRRWVTAYADTDPAMLYNPLSRVRRAANWDDRGEAYRLGTGPDLWLDVTVPAGSHRLSLYFVNDRNYYEARRTYTVSVFDEQDRYLTGSEVRGFVNGVYQQFAVTGPAKLKVLISRNLSMNVLLAGVFLDTAGAPEIKVQLSGRLHSLAQAWQTQRRRNQSPLAERAALRTLASGVKAQGTAGEAAAFLDAVFATDLQAHRYGPAAWAAQARVRLPEADREKRLRPYVQAFIKLAQTAPVSRPHETKSSVAWPLVESLFRDYLAAGAEGLEGQRLAQFYRGAARYFGQSLPGLTRIAYAELVALGPELLTAEDQYQMTATAPDRTQDIARLEQVLAAKTDLPNRAGLQLQLLGRYLTAERTTQAEALVAQMRQAAPQAPQTVNALYNLGVYHYNAKRVAQARVCFAAVTQQYQDTPWAKYASRYLQRLTAPAPVAK